MSSKSSRIVLQSIIFTLSLAAADSALAMRAEPSENPIPTSSDSVSPTVPAMTMGTPTAVAPTATPVPMVHASESSVAATEAVPVSLSAATMIATPPPPPAAPSSTTTPATTSADVKPVISQTTLLNILNNPRSATGARYDIKDNLGNAMQSVSILQLDVQSYAAVYHTPYAVPGGYRYRVNLAVSKDLMNWTFVRLLVDNADMPKISAVTGSRWILLVHEQWTGAGQASTAPCRVKYELFYDSNDLVNGTIRSSYVAPAFAGNLNGTPSVYEAHMINRGGFYVIDGTFGFHYWSGVRDMNASSTVTNLFRPSGGTSANFQSLDDYNALLMKSGVTGNIGQRDTLQTSTGRYNLQEGNVGAAGGSWDAWRVWLYTYNDSGAEPNGKGTVVQLSPQTPRGSRSFGNPSLQVVDSPSGHGKSVVVSYFLFSEGAATGEAGGLLYYFDLPN